MTEILLVPPQKTHEQAAFDYIAEHGDGHINGVGGLDRFLGDYDGWLKKLADDENRIFDAKIEYVPGSTYFAVRENDGKIVGMTNIRHELNDWLLNYGGHIGYGVRPSERLKGYGSEICRLALEKCRELGLSRVLITCDKTNIGSARVIQKNGGLLENEMPDPESAVMRQRYWIDLKKT